MKWLLWGTMIKGKDDNNSVIGIWITRRCAVFELSRAFETEETGWRFQKNISLNISRS